MFGNAGYVVHQPHLYGTVFPLVECLSPTNRKPGQWIFYAVAGISCSLYISCKNLRMGMVGGKHQPWVRYWIFTPWLGVFYQPHLYGTVFPLVECLSPTNRKPGQWIFYAVAGISCSLYISCENLLMGMVGAKHQLWVRYGWWQTPTMGKPLKWFAFFANLFILTVPTVETAGYVVHQPHLYGTVFPLVECLSPTI
jgi:hypothetical protein